MSELSECLRDVEGWVAITFTSIWVRPLAPFRRPKKWRLLTDLGLLAPPLLVRHLLLDLVDLLERVHRLVEQERRVVHQHVDELDELLPGLGLVYHSELVNLEKKRMN